MRTQGRALLHQGQEWLHGRWEALEFGHNRRVAHFTCPVCNRSFTCTEDEVHDGEVRLEIGCPYHCPVREGVKLVGW